jgi:hypothetical protein
MRKIALRAATAGVATLCFIGACSKNEEQPPPAQPGQYPAYQQQPGYPASGQPQQYPQQQYPQQQYPQQQQPYPAQQQPYPATPAPGAPGATSQPSAVAFPCQTDVQCLSHRCNVQVGKCSWPCQTNDDCQPGFQCVTPACVPMLPQPQQ